MVEIGFGTNSLYRTDMELNFIPGFNHAVGGTALEIGFAHYSDIKNHKIPKDVKEYASKANFVTVHAPWKGIRYGDNRKTGRVLDKLTDYLYELKVDGIVIHPDIVDDFGFLNKSGFPFLIENIDKGKEMFTQPRDIECLLNSYDFGFVLDVKHAYDNDPSMESAERFLEISKNRLSHLHVSGRRGDQGHTLLYESENAEKISEILKKVPNTPRILEGILEGENILDKAIKEIEFVKQIK